MTQETTDVWLAAYILKRGHKIESYSVIARGKVKCQFKLSDAEWNKLKLDFNNSEFAEYKALVGKIRDLGY